MNALPDQLTPVTVPELADAFRADGVPELGVRILVAHSAFEVGWWKDCHNYNLGNEKAGEDETHTLYPCGEELTIPQWTAVQTQGPCSKVRTYTRGGVPMVSAHFDPPHPMCRFAAFATLVEGAAYYLGLLRGRYAVAYAAACTGDLKAFVTALKARGYFTDDIDDYEKKMEGVLAMVDAKMPTDPAPPSETAPGLSLVRQVFLEIARSFVGIDAGSQRQRYEDAVMPMPPEPQQSHAGYDAASGCALWQRAFIRQVCVRLGLPLPARLQAAYRMSMAVVDVLEMARAKGAYVVCPRPFAVDSVRPLPGDIPYIGGSGGTYEHVLCVEALDGLHATVIQGGVIVNGHQGVNRETSDWTAPGGQLHIGNRVVNGWVNIDKLFT